MGIRIEYDDYVITSDCRQYIINEIYDKENDVRDEKGEYKFKQDKFYYTKMDSLLAGLIERMGRQSDAKSFKELHQKMEKIKNELVELCGMSGIKNDIKDTLG